MTQVKCLAQLPRGLSPAAYRYAVKRDHWRKIGREAKEAKAAAREANTALPPVKSSEEAKRAFLAAMEDGDES